MYSPLSEIIIKFNDNVSLFQVEKEQIVLSSPQHKLTFKSVEPGLRKALFAKANNGASSETMSNWLQQDRGKFIVLKFYQYLQKFTSFGWLCHVVATKECHLATAKPMTKDARFSSAIAIVDRQYILSKFAYIHQVKRQTILESPLSKMTLHLSN